MFGFVIALLVALVASFGYIFYQAVLLKKLSQELENNLPPF